MNVEKKRPEIWVTTDDNPFNPFTQYRRWRWYDREIGGYYTEDKIAYLAPCDDDNLSEEENRDVLDQALINLASSDWIFGVSPDSERVVHYRIVSPKDCVDF